MLNYQISTTHHAWFNGPHKDSDSHEARCRLGPMEKAVAVTRLDKAVSFRFAKFNLNSKRTDCGLMAVTRPIIQNLQKT